MPYFCVNRQCLIIFMITLGVKKPARGGLVFGHAEVGYFGVWRLSCTSITVDGGGV